MRHLSGPSDADGTMATYTPSTPLRSLKVRSGRAVCLLALAGMNMLAGCAQSPARQDSYTTPLSTCAYMMPTVSGTRTHGYHGMPGTIPSNRVDSAVAYNNPQTPAFCDRPLPDTLRSSLELADYTHLLDSSGLLATLQQAGPFTVFALPNAALENYNTRLGGQLLNPTHINTVRDMLAYTIVTGNWPHKALRAAVDAAPAHSLSLPTLSGQPLTVWLDQTTDQIMVGTPNGVNSQLWVMGIPQSNGVLYFTRSLLLPPKAQVVPTPNTTSAP